MENTECRTCDLANFPDVPLLRIFSYLNMKQKLTCSRVCKNWYRLIYSPCLWKQLKVTNWAYLNDTEINNLFNYHSHSMGLLPKRLWFILREGYVQITGGIEDVKNDMGYDLRLYKKVINEYRVLIGCLENILPKVGQGVVSLFLDTNGGLTDYLLNLYLMLCPNVEHLDVRYTSISHRTFKDLESCGACQKITHLNLMGCELISDATILNLTRCWGYEDPNSSNSLNEINNIEKVNAESCDIMVPYCVKPVSEVCKELVTVENFWFHQDEVESHIGRDLFKTFTYPVTSSTCSTGLKSLNLAGCDKLTDRSLEYLSKCPRIVDLEILDVSGCSGFSSKGLKTLVKSCTKLKPESLYYCNRICDGPYAEEANGCQTDDDAMCSCMFKFKEHI